MKRGVSSKHRRHVRAQLPADQRGGPGGAETITQTEYVVRIVIPKGPPETNLRLGHQFTPTINKAIGTAVRQAAEKALRQYVASGRLDWCFRVQNEYPPLRA